jgi:hypothetical protein
MAKTYHKSFLDLKHNDYFYYVDGLDPVILSYRIDKIYHHYCSNNYGILFTAYSDKELFVPSYYEGKTSYRSYYTTLDEAVKAFKKRLNTNIVN